MGPITSPAPTGQQQPLLEPAKMATENILVKPSNKSVDNPDSIHYQESLRGIWRKFSAGGIYTTESTGHSWDGRYSVQERSR